MGALPDDGVASGGRTFPGALSPKEPPGLELARLYDAATPDELPASEVTYDGGPSLKGSINGCGWEGIVSLASLVDSFRGADM